MATENHNYREIASWTVQKQTAKPQNQKATEIKAEPSTLPAISMTNLSSRSSNQSPSY